MPWRENRITLVPLLLSATALALTIGSNAWCEYISFTDPNSGYKARYGIWYYSDTFMTQSPLTGGMQIVTRCLVNPSGTPYDAKWKAAKSFSVICPVIGGVATVWVMFAQCFYSRGNSIWRCLGMTFIWCSLFSGLTLLFLGSNACKDNPILQMQISSGGSIGGDPAFPDTCVMDWGAKTQIASTIIWFLAGLSIFVIKPPVRPSRPPPETQNVTYTKTTQADGTEVTTKNVVKGVAVTKEVEP